MAERAETKDTIDTALHKSVDLDAPIKRGNSTVKSIVVRKPNAGSLRGAALTDLLQMDVQTLIKVLPRVTEPALSEAELRELNPADLFQLGEAVSSFLLPKKYQAG